MNLNIKQALEYYFNPNNKLLLSEFSCANISSFDNNPEGNDKLFNLISIEWWKIDWDKVSNLSLEGSMIIDFLNESTYKHVFPSLVFELTRKSNFLVDIFIENHLNINNVYKDWELEFYFNFDGNLRKLVGSVLERISGNLAQIALESYWL
jgi:hypothetical protein